MYQLSRKTRTVLAALVCVSLVSAVGAASIDGRVYITSRAATDNASIFLSSMYLNADGTNTGLVSHGSITDNGMYGDQKRHVGISPEILTSNAAGYATLMMGAGYNNSPAGGYVGQPAEQTMDVLAVTPTSGSSNIDVLSDGASYGGVGKYVTTRGLLAMPDVTGQFTGSAGHFVSVNRRTSTGDSPYMAVIGDHDGSGVIGDNATDACSYIYNPTRFSTARDAEISGSHLYYTNAYYNEEKIYCITNSAAGQDMNTQALSVSIFAASGVSLIDPARGMNIGYNQESYGLAMGEINGHTAAWVRTRDRGYDVNASVDTYRIHLSLFIDLNDDGDAQDAGEIAHIYGNTSQSLNIGGTDDIDKLYIKDMELVSQNGKLFLLMLSDAANYYQLSVMELDPTSGLYVQDSYKTILTSTTSLGTSIEFDAVVPEPMSLAILIASVPMLLAGAEWPPEFQTTLNVTLPGSDVTGSDATGQGVLLLGALPINYGQRMQSEAGTA